MRPFTREEVHELFSQHTSDTGQAYSADAVDLAFQLTAGQPSLVNALAWEATEVVERDRARAVSREVMEAAGERVVAREDADAHIGWLLGRVREDRVRRVLEPIVVAGTRAPNISRADLRYVLDIGLLRSEGGALEIANPIYEKLVRSHWPG